MKQTKENNQIENQRFTTLINPQLLSQIKLISYLTNQKLYELINNSLKLQIQKFELDSNTKLDDIINLQSTHIQIEELEIIDLTDNLPKK
jgi:hypothetical protein